MNTKHRILSVLLILAMVATLCVIMAAPAGATVTAVTLTPATSAVAAANSVQNIAFTNATALAIGDTISITFPAAYGLPTTAQFTAAGAAAVTVNATNAGLATATAGQVVTITSPVAVAAGAGVAVSFTIVGAAAAGGIPNPVVGTYRVQVVTSKETTPVNSAFYNITGAGYVTTGATTVAPARGGSVAAYTIAFTPGVNVPVSTGVLTILFPLGTTVPDYIAASNVRVNSMVPSSAPYVFTNTSVSSAATHPRGVSIVNPSAAVLAAGALITVEFNTAAAIVNPSTAGNYQVLVFTTVEAGEVADAAYAIGRTISISPTTGAAGTTITIVGGGFAPYASVDIYADVGANNTFVAGTDPI
ncbi:MAG: hypothetical protein WC749_06600, partial [Dehalococcoidia bacterium]